MRAHLKGGRSIMVHIIDVAEEVDLCLLEGIPGTRGLELAEMESKSINVVGHPRLGPLTPSSGFLLAQDEIRIPDESIPTQEACNGPRMEWREVDTLFGPMGVCFLKFHAWLTSAIIHPGSSGSPVFNVEGRVQNVVFAGSPSTNYGVVIPLDQLREYLEIF
jgi:hypothetical protein